MRPSSATNGIRSTADRQINVSQTPAPKGGSSRRCASDWSTSVRRSCESVCTAGRRRYGMRGGGQSQNWGTQSRTRLRAENRGGAPGDADAGHVPLARVGLGHRRGEASAGNRPGSAACNAQHLQTHAHLPGRRWARRLCGGPGPAILPIYHLAQQLVQGRVALHAAFAGVRVQHVLAVAEGAEGEVRPQVHRSSNGSAVPMCESGMPSSSASRSWYSHSSGILPTFADCLQVRGEVKPYKKIIEQRFDEFKGATERSARLNVEQAKWYCRSDSRARNRPRGQRVSDPLIGTAPTGWKIFHEILCTYYSSFRPK
eukprot:scaffold4126_cov383-Prasinococcus_capsulatus_cf.AAC.12